MHREQRNKGAKETDQIIEYGADYEAISIIEELGYESSEYLQVLKRLLAFEEQNVESQEIPGWLLGRTQCLEQFLSPSAASIRVVFPGLGSDDSAEEQIGLKPDEQYALCVLARVYMSKKAGQQLIEWLDFPETRMQKNSFGRDDKQHLASFLNAVVSSQRAALAWIVVLADGNVLCEERGNCDAE